MLYIWKIMLYVNYTSKKKKKKKSKGGEMLLEGLGASPRAESTWPEAAPARLAVRDMRLRF